MKDLETSAASCKEKYERIVSKLLYLLANTVFKIKIFKPYVKGQADCKDVTIAV